jgi:hypothetical protein
MHTQWRSEKIKRESEKASVIYLTSATQSFVHRWISNPAIAAAEISSGSGIFHLKSSSRDMTAMSIVGTSVTDLIT